MSVVSGFDAIPRLSVGLRDHSLSNYIVGPVMKKEGEDVGVGEGCREV
jgi:hypothetical protein